MREKYHNYKHSAINQTSKAEKRYTVSLLKTSFNKLGNKSEKNIIVKIIVQ